MKLMSIYLRRRSDKHAPKLHFRQKISMEIQKVLHLKPLELSLSLILSVKKVSYHFSHILFTEIHISVIMRTGKFYVRRNNKSVDSIETRPIIIADFLP